MKRLTHRRPQLRERAYLNGLLTLATFIAALLGSRYAPASDHGHAHAPSAVTAPPTAAADTHQAPGASPTKGDHSGGPAQQAGTHDGPSAPAPVAEVAPAPAPVKGHGPAGGKKRAKYSPGVSAAHAPNAPAHSRAPTAVDALASDQALGWLKEGNARYVAGKTTGPARDLATRQELSKGQHPYAIILSCSDSRVPPELVFDQGFGQLFVVRVAGNVVGAATVASIEYAAEHLGSKLLVVMGHESCGAVKAAMDTPPTKSAGSMDLDTLVSAIRPNIESYRKLASTSSDPEAKTLRTPVKLNVNGVAARLLKRSKILRHLVHTGKLKVVGGVYGLASGEVEFWNAD